MLHYLHPVQLPPMLSHQLCCHLVGEEQDLQQAVPAVAQEQHPPLPHADTVPDSAGRGMHTQEGIQGRPLRGGHCHAPLLLQRHRHSPQLLLPQQTAGTQREAADTRNADSTAGDSQDSPTGVVAAGLPLRLAAPDTDQVADSDRLLVALERRHLLPPVPVLRRLRLPT